MSNGTKYLCGETLTLLSCVSIQVLNRSMHNGMRAEIFHATYLACQHSPARTLVGQLLHQCQSSAWLTECLLPAYNHITSHHITSHHITSHHITESYCAVDYCQLRVIHSYRANPTASGTSRQDKFVATPEFHEHIDHQATSLC